MLRVNEIMEKVSFGYKDVRKFRGFGVISKRDFYKNSLRIVFIKMRQVFGEDFCPDDVSMKTSFGKKEMNELLFIDALENFTGEELLICPATKFDDIEGLLEQFWYLGEV